MKGVPLGVKGGRATWGGEVGRLGHLGNLGVFGLTASGSALTPSDPPFGRMPAAHQHKPPFIHLRDEGWGHFGACGACGAFGTFGAFGCFGSLGSFGCFGCFGAPDNSLKWLPFPCTWPMLGVG